MEAWKLGEGTADKESNIMGKKANKEQVTV